MVEPDDTPTSGFFIEGVIMAKQIQKEKSLLKKKAKRTDILVLEPINYKIIGLGVLIILIGYLALNTSPWDNPIALNVAPILLVLGYCVIIPFGIIYKKKKTASHSVASTTDQVQV
jgi:hypothetical protein